MFHLCLLLYNVFDQLLESFNMLDRFMRQLQEKVPRF
jgi:hypothetical protein